MRVIHFDASSELKAETETLEDLWLLSRLVEKGDLIEARSFRRFKSELSREDSGEKKAVTVKLETESIEFSESANKLRITGKIVSAFPPEYAPTGHFHTVDIELHSVFTLFKKFLKYHMKLLDDAKKHSRKQKLLIVAMDDSNALLASLRERGVKFLFEIGSHASKRDMKSFDSEKEKFFSEMLSAIVEISPQKIIVAGPGFEKENFRKYVSEKNRELSEKIVLESAGSAERSAIYELLKKGIIGKAGKAHKSEEEFGVLERLKRSVAKEDGLSCYGLDEVKSALENRSVSEFLILDSLLRTDKTLNSLLESAEQQGAKILIFDSESDSGKEFESFRIAAILRYKKY